jgi:hypothetical protein
MAQQYSGALQSIHHPQPYGPAVPSRTPQRVPRETRLESTRDPRGGRR